MSETLRQPAPQPSARPVGTGHAELDNASELVERGLLLLEAARRQAKGGMRVAGPAGDEQRAAVLAMTAQADADLYEARMILDRLLRASALEGVYAPRPIFELPPAGQASAAPDRRWRRPRG